MVFIFGWNTVISCTSLKSKLDTLPLGGNRMDKLPLVPKTSESLILDHYQRNKRLTNAGLNCSIFIIDNCSPDYCAGESKAIIIMMITKVFIR